MKSKYIKLSAGSVTVLALLFVVWFVRAPYSTLISIREAAMQEDTATLNRLIDFPAFRSSIKMLVAESMDTQQAAGGAGNALVKMLVSAFTGPIIDAMVTPESIASMFSGKLPGKGRGGNTASPDAEGNNVTVTKTWEGLSIQRVRFQQGTNVGNGVTFIMRRDGLSWRLSALER